MSSRPAVTSHATLVNAETRNEADSSCQCFNIHLINILKCGNILRSTPRHSIHYRRSDNSKVLVRTVVDSTAPPAPAPPHPKPHIMHSFPYSLLSNCQLTHFIPAAYSSRSGFKPRIVLYAPCSCSVASCGTTYPQNWCETKVYAAAPGDHLIFEIYLYFISYFFLLFFCLNKIRLGFEFTAGVDVIGKCQISAFGEPEFRIWNCDDRGGDWRGDIGIWMENCNCRLM
jgi:hypothetical protein